MEIKLWLFSLEELELYARFVRELSMQRAGRAQDAEAVFLGGMAVVADESDAATTDNGETTPPPASLTEAIDVLREYSAQKGAEKARELLDGFGARRLPDLSDEQRATFVAQMRAALAA